MANDWTTHFEDVVADRPVSLKTYVDGGYRVSTLQGADDDGSVSGDDTGLTLMPPTSKGRRIDIDGETLEELSEQLASEGFTDEDVAFILSHLPK